MSNIPILPNGWEPMTSKKIGSATRNTNEPGGSRLELSLDVPMFDDEQLEKIEQYNDPFIEITDPEYFTVNASGMVTGSLFGEGDYDGRFQIVVPYKKGSVDIVGISTDALYTTNDCVQITLPKSIAVIESGAIGAPTLERVIYNGSLPTTTGWIYPYLAPEFSNHVRGVKHDETWGAEFQGKPVVFHILKDPKTVTFDFIDIALPSLAATSYSTQLLAQRKWATQGVSRIIAGDSISGTIECPGEVYAYIQGMIGAKGTARIVIPSQGVFSQWRVAILSVDGPSLVDGDRMTGSLVLTVTNTGPNDRDEMKPQFGEISDDFYYSEGVTLSDTETQPDPDYPIEPVSDIL